MIFCSWLDFQKIISVSKAEEREKLEMWCDYVHDVPHYYIVKQKEKRECIISRTACTQYIMLSSCALVSDYQFTVTLG